MSDSLQKSTLTKVSWRLLPLIVIIYFVAYIDRTNVSFAAFGMKKDLGIGSYVFGWGAGIFFWGYFLFEVPSNLALMKVGARIWIARIMITWGILAAASALAQGPASFLALRFLLGVAEAGFFPGIILYFTFWFPRAYRARVIAVLFLAVPGTNAVTALVSTAVLQMDGIWGVPGWQWLFMVEAAPAILLAFVVLIAMTDRPAKAKWLTAEQRDWLEGVLTAEREATERVDGKLSIWQTLSSPRVLLFAAMYLTVVTPVYGITFFLPQIVKAMGNGMTMTETGLLTALPYIIGTIGMVIWSFSSDRRAERRWHFIIAALVGGVGLAMAGYSSASTTALIGLSIATVGIYGTKPCFWSMPPEFLTGAAAASGIALINSIGNLGGFIGPYLIGLAKEETGNYAAGLYMLAASSAISGVIAFFAVRRRTPPAYASLPGSATARSA